MFRVFCDFDGTISTDDIGNALFRRYAGEAAVEIVQRYLAGEITAPEYYRAECNAVESLSRVQLHALVDQCSIDPSFKEFVGLCRAHEIPLTILSDGFDVYVEHFLDRHGLSHLRYFANHLEFVPDGNLTKIVPSFPYTDAECPTCAHCKRNHLLTLSGDDDVLIYIGDGYSDRCPVRYADIVFAKRGLVRYCQEQNITYHEFKSFADVIVKMKQVLQQKRVKQRREAVHARRALFMQG